jgi:hypothetical protein
MKLGICSLEPVANLDIVVRSVCTLYWNIVKFMYENLTAFLHNPVK